MKKENVKMKLLSCISTAVLMYFSNVEAAYINEIHYDNTGADTGEAIELITALGDDLSGWSLVLYNGSDGTQYNTIGLSGAATNPVGSSGAVAVVINTPSIQNGPDGIALVYGTNNVIQFLSYEGAFTATDGPAIGLTSMLIGVTESNADPAGMSLQLTGTGNKPEDFTWSGPLLSTFGTQNINQVITDGHTNPVPIPAAFWLFGSGLVGLIGVARRKKA